MNWADSKHSVNCWDTPSRGNQQPSAPEGVEGSTTSSKSIGAKPTCPETRSTRKCNKCGVEKPLDEDNYPSFVKKGKKLLRGTCKVCHTQDRYTNELWRKFNLTYQAYMGLLETQGHKCEICETKFTKKGRGAYPVVDHNHKTGVVRGVLCHTCNAGLGMFKDSPHRLENALHYLSRSPGEDIV